MSDVNILDDQLNNQANNSLSVDEESYLIKAAYWSRFLGIVGFVACGFIVLAILFLVGAGGSALMNTPGMAGFGSIGLGAIAGIYALVGAFYFACSLFLYRFGVKMRNSLERGYEGDERAEGFKNLRNYFQLSGILVACFIGLYALLFLFGMLAMMVR